MKTRKKAAQWVSEAVVGMQIVKHTPSRVEPYGCKTKRRIVRVGGESAVCTSVWCEGDAEGKPEGTEGAEDYAWEGVAQNPLSHVSW